MQTFVLSEQRLVPRLDKQGFTVLKSIWCKSVIQIHGEGLTAVFVFYVIVEFIMMVTVSCYPAVNNAICEGTGMYLESSMHCLYQSVSYMIYGLFITEYISLISLHLLKTQIYCQWDMHWFLCLLMCPILTMILSSTEGNHVTFKFMFTAPVSMWYIFMPETLSLLPVYFNSMDY